MRQAGAGFTMLELLVAITLMALVTGSLYGSLYVGIKAHRSATNGVKPARIAANTLELLRQDFDAVMPPTGVLAGGFIGTDGVAVSDSLSFYSCANVPGETEVSSDMRRVELEVATIADDTQPVLVRRLTTNLLATTSNVVREQILCRNVRSMNLRFFDGSLWLDTWDSGGQDNILPAAVEITLEFARTAEQQLTTPERPYRVTRIFKLACARPLESTAVQQAPAGAQN